MKNTYLAQESMQAFRNSHYRTYILYKRFQRFLGQLFPYCPGLDPNRIPAHSLPIIVNNFNRLDSLKELIEWVRELDYLCHIIIIDNASNYPPLLDYYKRIEQDKDISLLKLKRNTGLETIQKVTNVLRNHDYYVVTDADLVPYRHTPKDVLGQLKEVLDSSPFVNHVGLSLEIQDIPKEYPLRDEVIEWESKFWRYRAGPDAYWAGVDTTFAMYRKNSLVYLIEPALRLDRPYTLKHTDWYIDPLNLTEEQVWYVKTCNAMATWSQRLKEEYLVAEQYAKEMQTANQLAG